VNCATIKKVEIAEVKKHYDGVAAGTEEVARLTEPSDHAHQWFGQAVAPTGAPHLQQQQQQLQKQFGIPLAINPYSSLPSSSSMLEPPGELSDSSVTDDEASQAGLLLHLMTNRVHVCSDSGALKTRCGLAFSNDLELKTTQISCSDLKCAKCFRIRKVALPGRQAA